VLTPAQRRRLDHLGKDGRTLAAAVDATAPKAHSNGEEAKSPPEASGRSPLGQLFEAFGGNDDGNGLGLLLPLILLVALLGALALVVARRRSAS
jgi:hypothetical protein